MSCSGMTEPLGTPSLVMLLQSWDRPGEQMRQEGIREMEEEGGGDVSLCGPSAAVFNAQWPQREKRRSMEKGNGRSGEGEGGGGVGRASPAEVAELREGERDGADRNGVGSKDDGLRPLHA